ncbi:Protocatechuate 3,4-dioxygenase alpha chain [Polystyrenella longa]|uniref:Protocatechuate 3,4-dioxygenase alpha chain n=1 Tax=Polystyrenella longa TaxID=2528007 RepID=A0A518CP38_9PLAN|nr:protocatechuate 3,4-dioxygenase [Polystyrenella longa]QDU80987.1 Protocatechuate 3,4-dioxygenase alpha chain [Polystyrenella longa]
MYQDQYAFSRRHLLKGGVALGAAFFTTPGLFAEELMKTPRMTKGPFYPDHLPLDQDNDLIIMNDSTTPAVGDITHLTGKILLPNSEPAKNVTIEIWQCDANAVYLHSADSSRKKEQQDQHFQGYGRFETNAKGEYRFRTIKPVPYPGRPAPHIHYIVKKGDQELLTSQIFMSSFKGNQQDGVYRRAGSADQQKLVETEFKAIPDSKMGEYAAKFDIVLGQTPDERSLKKS